MIIKFNGSNWVKGKGEGVTGLVSGHKCLAFYNNCSHLVPVCGLSEITFADYSSGGSSATSPEIMDNLDYDGPDERDYPDGGDTYTVTGAGTDDDPYVVTVTLHMAHPSNSVKVTVKNWPHDGEFTIGGSPAINGKYLSYSVDGNTISRTWTAFSEKTPWPSCTEGGNKYFFVENVGTSIFDNQSGNGKKVNLSNYGGKAVTTDYQNWDKTWAAE